MAFGWFSSISYGGAVATALDAWIAPGIVATRVEATTWFAGAQEGERDWSAAQNGYVTRALKYWHSGVSDVCASLRRPFDATDAANAALLWSGQRRSAHSLERDARAHFTTLVNSSVEAFGEAHIDVGRLALYRSQAMFLSLAGGPVRGAAAQRFGARLMKHAEVSRMAADKDFVPRRLVKEAVLAARDYIKNSDATFGSSLQIPAQVLGLSQRTS